MNRLFTFFTLSAASLFCLQACTVSSTEDNISSPVEKEWSLSKGSLPERELEYNRSLISMFYVNADKELHETDYYLNRGEKYGFTSDNYVFPDVSFMYATLSDSYTRYIDPHYAEMILNYLTYSESGIGIGASVREIQVSNCEIEEECTDTTTMLVFNRVYRGAPAEKAGIKVGDTLQSIDGTIPGSSIAFEKLSTGKSGESTNIVVKRGEEKLSFSVVFAEYLSPTVFVETIDSIPVIAITEFSDTTAMGLDTYKEFIDALKQTEGAKSTVIDLRGNPGGTVELCVQMAAELLPQKDTILSMVIHELDSIGNARIDTLTWVVEEDGIAKDRYYVFLADSNSASCSEMMIAGVTNNRKSPIVGQTTYGKGIGQIYMGTVAGGLAGITCLRVFDKNGNTYQRYGIEPDFEESDPDKALLKAIELAKEGQVERTKGYGTVDLGHFTLEKSHSQSMLPDRGAFIIHRDPINIQ